jgi:3-hydroxyacyl-CoA dehydrogenase
MIGDGYASNLIPSRFPLLRQRVGIMPRIAIIGAGIIGSSWSIVFARAGHDVQVFDHRSSNLHYLKDRVATAARTAAAVVPDISWQVVVDRISPCADLNEAVSGADYVQECVGERVETKATVFAELDRLTSADVVLASSTSSIGVSQFTEELPGRDRCIVVHPATPPHLLPVVEIVPAPWTPQSTIDRARSRMVECGQRPVLIRRETPGFVLNRLQGALLIEMFRAVSDGLISINDADSLIRDGFGLRWAFLGPFQGIDLNAPGGISEYLRRYGFLFDSMAREAGATAPVVTELLIQTLDQAMRAQLPVDKIQERRTWRDERLAMLRGLRDRS